MLGNEIVIFSFFSLLKQSFLSLDLGDGAALSNVKDLVEERIKISAIILWEILLVCWTSGTFVFFFFFFF